MARSNSGAAGSAAFPAAHDPAVPGRVDHAAQTLLDRLTIVPCQLRPSGQQQVILARRSDSGPEAVYVQVRCGVEFELNGPPS